jgi:hypothetical protein
MDKYGSLQDMPGVEFINRRLPPKTRPLHDEEFIQCGTIMCCREQLEGKCAQWYQEVLDLKRGLVAFIKALAKKESEAASPQQANEIFNTGSEKFRKRVRRILDLQNMINECNGMAAKTVPVDLLEAVSEAVRLMAVALIPETRKDQFKEQAALPSNQGYL